MPLDVWIISVEEKLGIPRSTGEWYFRDSDVQAARSRLQATGRYARVDIVGPIACEVPDVNEEVVNDWCNRR